MEAPQYRGDEVLRVAVHAGWVTGDLNEIEILNEYVGVRLPLDTPELAATPWVLGTLLLLALAAVLSPAGRRRGLAAALCVAMALVLLGGAAMLQFRLYQMGHDRSPEIMRGVDDFTPPILGTRKIANFTATMSLGAGGWAYLGALTLAVWSTWRQRRRGAGAGSAESAGAPLAAAAEGDGVVKLRAIGAGGSL